MASGGKQPRTGGLAAAGCPCAPAAAALDAGGVTSSASARMAESSSSFSASKGATSRNFSATCCNISICLPSWAYLACLRRKTSWMSFMKALY